MKLKNILIVVKDIEKSKEFYHKLFGLETILDNDGNMILTEGLVLQEESIWKKFTGKDVIPENNACELYFEEKNIEAFIEKLEKYDPSVKYVNRLMTHSWGQKVIRFYDPDGRKVNEERLEELLDLLKLKKRRKHLPNQLSGGQQQRVSVGRALMNAPTLVLADEPTGNLDSENSKEIMKLLRYSNRTYDQTLIVITHDENIALQADRIISLEDGRIVRDEVIR